MTMLVPAPPVEIGTAILAHLAEQLESSRRLLDAVLRQGAATRRQDVEGVITCLTEIQGEMDRRSKLETERARLLVRAAGMLGREPHAVTLDELVTLMEPADAWVARERSAELRGLLGEIQREHVVNRALMRQELAFLDHLVRLVGAEEEPGYRPGGAGVGGPGSSPAAFGQHRVLDLKA
ncbi:MAG TPA: flagellar export chaperone FlgN [Solirubrobacteraceae bacterium]|nr:flagellar export chaperone FlgN [Solirubrobacteraceae bacterium]